MFSIVSNMSESLGIDLSDIDDEEEVEVQENIEE